jgi:hypothetical protein
MEDRAIAGVVLDSAGNVLEEHSFEANHTDTNGIDLSSNSDYVRTSVNRTYDGAGRLIKVTDCGCSRTPWAYSPPRFRAGKYKQDITVTRHVWFPYGDAYVHG